MIPWGLERHYRRTGDLDFVAACWPMVEQAAAVCGGASGHPGLRLLEDLNLVSSAGIWDQRFGAFLYSERLRGGGPPRRGAAGRAARPARAAPRRWQALADRIWETGILGRSASNGDGPGLVDPESGRFLEARRLSTLRGLWTDHPELLIDRSPALDISLLGLVVPFGLLPAVRPPDGPDRRGHPPATTPSAATRTS